MTELLHDMQKQAQYMNTVHSTQINYSSQRNLLDLHHHITRLA